MDSARTGRRLRYYQQCSYGGGGGGGNTHPLYTATLRGLEAVTPDALLQRMNVRINDADAVYDPQPLLSSCSRSRVVFCGRESVFEEGGLILPHLLDVDLYPAYDVCKVGTTRPFLPMLHGRQKWICQMLGGTRF